MWENWSSQLHAPGKATGDKTYSLLSYSRLLEASVNALSALKAPWNLLMWDQEGYGYQTTWLVEEGRLVDLGKRSRHYQGPTFKPIHSHAGGPVSYRPWRGPWWVRLVTLPGKARCPRECTLEELAAIWEGGEAMGLTQAQALVNLGETTGDVYLKESAHWHSIPAKV
jgi:hypothetical protein